HRVADALEGGLEPFALLGNRLFGAPLFGHVAEHQHGPDRLVPVPGANRGAAVGDRDLGAVAPEQHGVVGEADDVARAHHHVHRVLDRAAGLFVDNAEHLRQRPAQRLVRTPPGHGFGGGVQERNPAVPVGRDHAVADAGERDAEVLLLRGELAGEALLLRDVADHLRDADDVAGVVEDGRGGQRHLDPAAILRDAHRLQILDPATPADFLEDHLLLRVPLGRNQAVDRASDELFARIAEDAVTALVARGDDAVQVLRDDRVGRRRNDGGQVRLLFSRTLTLGDVARDLGSADDLARRTDDGRDRERDVDQPAILGDPHRLVVPDALAAPDARDDLVFLRLPV